MLFIVYRFSPIILSMKSSAALISPGCQGRYPTADSPGLIILSWVCTAIYHRRHDKNVVRASLTHSTSPSWAKRSVLFYVCFVFFVWLKQLHGKMESFARVSLSMISHLPGIAEMHQRLSAAELSETIYANYCSWKAAMYSGRCVYMPRSSATCTRND